MSADLVRLNLSAVLCDQVPLRAVRPVRPVARSAAEAVHPANSASVSMSPHPGRRRLGPSAPFGPQPQQPSQPTLNDLRVQSDDRHALVSALSSLELPCQPASRPLSPQPLPTEQTVPSIENDAEESSDLSVELLVFQICSQVG